MDTVPGTVDISHVDGLSIAFPVASLPNGSNIDGSTNYTSVRVDCHVCGTVSFYPMAGGNNAQYLHYMKMLALPLSEVQAIADARGLTTTGTQEDLAVSILQNECDIQGVQYFNLQGHD
jgi:hypothetical protein